MSKIFINDEFESDFNKLDKSFSKYYHQVSFLLLFFLYFSC